jgi:hypothetical protein
MLALAAGACRKAEPPRDEAAPAPAETADAGFAGPIERAHGLAAWRSHPAFGSGLTVEFGGRPMIEGRMLFRIDLGATRLELADGTVVVFDGTSAWVSPAGSNLPRARFHALTWPYFVAAPMKLSDPGTHLEPLGSRQLQGETFDAARLTFDPGTGDSPDDWYVLYRDPGSGLLRAMAYIVTYDRSAAEAEAEPHAITYHDFAEVDGVKLATAWKLWNWNEAEGIVGEPIGQARLADSRFLQPDLGAFDRVEGAREDPLPAGGR